jgi:chaperonin GroES
MKLVPLESRVIVRRKCEEETKGGIILPEYTKKVSLEGEVVAAGKDCESVKPGTKILFSKYSGDEQPFWGIRADNGYKNCIIMNEADILCIVEDD